jgi:hypothetical protein
MESSKCKGCGKQDCESPDLCLRDDEALPSSVFIVLLGFLVWFIITFWLLLF